MSKNKKVTITDNDFYISFQEQVSFLQVAANEFDNGNWPAIKMAGSAMRILFYQQRYGPILIDKISKVNKYHFFSPVKFSKNAEYYTGPIFPRLHYNPLSNKVEPIYLPMLSRGKTEMHKISFYHWWNGRFLVLGKESLTRKELVNFIANQDGGAHVDVALYEKYYNLVHDLSHTTITPTGIKPANMNLALFRQIVHEVLFSFDKMKLLSKPYSSKKAEDYFIKMTSSLATSRVMISNLKQYPGTDPGETEYY